ncbi:MAG: hypothetical protein H7Z14_01515 [Anaerolineae bacterium]|nr:hypothetical protein [Phycisphaerae bacterium]
MTTESSGTSASNTADIVAKAGRYYRNTRYLMFVVVMGFGIAFLYDGFIRYPRHNRELKALQDENEATTDSAKKQQLAVKIKEYQHHNDTSLLIQKLLGFSLPPLGIALLAWSLHRSRGEYRLSGTKLSVPGHPTIDLDDVKSVNNDLWDRKGIVWLKYETPNAQQGEIVLDDFVYDRPPTDAIYDVIAEKFGLNKDEDENEDAADNDAAGDDEDAASRTDSESSDAQR